MDRLTSDEQLEKESPLALKGNQILKKFRRKVLKQRRKTQGSGVPPPVKSREQMPQIGIKKNGSRAKMRQTVWEKVSRRLMVLNWQA